MPTGRDKLNKYVFRCIRGRRKRENGNACVTNNNRTWKWCLFTHLFTLINSQQWIEMRNLDITWFALIFAFRFIHHFGRIGLKLALNNNYHPTLELRRSLRTMAKWFTLAIAIYHRYVAAINYARNNIQLFPFDILQSDILVFNRFHWHHSASWWTKSPGDAPRRFFHPFRFPRFHKIK